MQTYRFLQKNTSLGLPVDCLTATECVRPFRLAAAMDIQSILINTYNPDPALRHGAEANLTAFLGVPGALASLMGLASDHSANRDLRQAASLVIKNKIQEFFKPDGAHLLPDADKESVKHVILQSLWVETDASIRGIFGEVVRNVSEYEYPDR